MTGDRRTAGDRPRWNAETQRWESGEAPSAYTPPPPPLPLFAPYEAGGRGADGVRADGRAGVRPEGADEGTVTGAGQGGDGVAGPYAGPWGRSSRRTPLVVITAAAVLGAGGVAAWISWDREGAADGPAARPGASVSESSFPPDTAVPSADAGTDTPPMDGLGGTDGPGGTAGATETGGPAAAELPPGFRVAEDPKGFTLAVPEGWERTSRDNGVFYTTSDESSLIQVFTIAEEDMTPLDLVRRSSEDLAARNEGYTEVGVGTVTGGDENPAGDAAELLYSYDSDRTGGRRQCVERVFTATDGEQYAVLVAAPAGQVADLRDLLETVLEPFEPGWD
ncbi:hypothetical protein ACFYYH_11740 [Streptomyces sp. NPDC002018]|uniref:hypothetical protein n=1 Tax=Streptomyces sp. NPDC002018 TaxID=3364629 RepID=UPI00368CFAEF